VSSHLSDLISTHGYWAVAIGVGLESMGIPAPGETILITAAIYAGTTHRLDIALVIASAALGAVVGDNIGFLIGRSFGYRLLHRYGSLLKITESRIRLGQFLFDRHGGKVVFFGRFVAVLRALAALLAGVNRMPWWRFVFFNAAGATMWATVYGVAAYVFGEQVERFSRPVTVGVLIVASAAVIGFIWFVRRHEAALEDRL
jgi:membrane protein DedA with SNARE-associated domain